MNRLWILTWCLLAPAVLGQTPAGRPPSVIWILADDLGWTDAAYAGSRFYETPRLDELAAGGMRFTGFYVSPTGIASVAAFLTGQYPARLGIFSQVVPEEKDPPRRLNPPVSQTNLPPDTATIATVLQASGYQTGLFGQWRFGKDEANSPRRRGFTEAVVTSGSHLAFETDPPAEIPEGTYLADYLTDRAIDFLQRHKDSPFFIHVAHRGVRAPFEGKPELVGTFAKKAPTASHRDAVYAAMIASLDESVGRLLDKLTELKLDESTVVIFTSDNGGVGGFADADPAGRRTGITDNAPLRGGNGMLYEGGLRVPFLMRWPGVIKAGSRTTQPALHIDLFPTLCDIAGVRPPASQPLDGVSLNPLLRNPGAHLGRDAIFWHFPAYLRNLSGTGWRTTPAGAVRAGNFKVLEFFEDGRLELYNVVEDLGEKNNLLRSLPDKAAELRDKLAAWREAVNAPMAATNGPAPRARP